MIPTIVPAAANRSCDRTVALPEQACTLPIVLILTPRGIEHHCFSHAAEILAAMLAEHLGTPRPMLKSEAYEGLVAFFATWLEHKFGMRNLHGRISESAVHSA